MANEITWRLEHERIGRLLLHYAMPAVIGTMVNALYNIVDRIFIGQGVGPLAMAGLTLTFPILLFLQAFGMLIGAGAATRVSIYLGRSSLHDLDERFITGFRGKRTDHPVCTGLSEYRGSGDAPDLPQFWLQRCHACFRLSEESNVYHADRGDNQCDT